MPGAGKQPPYGGCFFGATKIFERGASARLCGRDDYSAGSSFGQESLVDFLACIGCKGGLDLYSKQNSYIAMRVVNFSDARSALKSIIDQVSDDANYTVITRRDASDAVVMSLDTFNSLMETVHLLKSPANAAHLARSIDQYRKGKTRTRKLVDA
jgi:antitoxin YefM